MAIQYQRQFIESFEPEILFEAVAEAGFEHRLLTGSRFSGQLDHANLPHCRLDRGNYSLPCFARGAVPPGWVLVGMTDCKHQPAWVNGHDLGYDHLEVCAEGSSVDFRNSPGSSWYSVQLRREWLQLMALSCGAHELNIPTRGCVNITTTRLNAAALRNTIDQVFAADTRLPASYLDVAAGVIERRLIEKLIVALASDSSSIAAREHVIQRKRFFVECVEQFLSQRQAEPFQIDWLLAQTGLKERTLQRYCREVYGLTPAQLFGVARLNQIRRKLLLREHNSLNISSIARQWGVRHLGRFASQYHQLFGEYPRETLHRH